MAITEYAAFVTQMHNLAVMAESRDNAYRAADDKNEGKDGVMNISGIWEADPDSYDPEGAERMLEHGELTRFGSGTYAIGDIACCMHAERTAARACEERPAKTASAKRAALANPPDSPVRAALFALTPPSGKCPWMFRKILKRSARLIKDVQLTQTVTDFTFIFTLHLFGTSIQTHPYGVMRDDFNLWGKPFKIKLATPDEHGVKYQQFGHPGLPDDTIDTSHFWITDGGDRLMWESKMYRSDIDKEVTNLQQFIRKGGGLSSRK